MDREKQGMLAYLDLATVLIYAAVNQICLNLVGLSKAAKVPPVDTVGDAPENWIPLKVLYSTR